MQKIAVHKLLSRTKAIKGLFLILLSAPTLGVVNYKDSNSTIDRLKKNKFIIEPHVARQVAFWENIFEKYPSTSVLIHDSKYPNLIVDIIDLNQFAQKLDPSQLKTKRQRDQFCQRYLQRYNLALERFEQFGRRAVKFGAIEQRVYDVYRKDIVALNELYQGRIKLRNQAGLADEFAKALKRSESLMPHMERIFKNQGLPSELTRIVFVESMFNTKAISKVGASGVWQFMPKTARQFLYVNFLLDERLSPLKATQAAAEMLRENYQALKSWPLAITAYNHGKGGMKRAVRQVGSMSMDKIIRNYRARSFGFASSNFYAEFLAVTKVYERTLNRNQKTLSTPLQLTGVKMPKRVSIAQILRSTPLDKHTLQTHNQCIRPAAFQRKDQTTLPQNYEIYVPSQLASKVKVALNANSKQNIR